MQIIIKNPLVLQSLTFQNLMEILYFSTLGT